MLKRFALIGALAAAFASNAAADTPKDVNGCLDQSLALFKSAGEANLAEDKQGQVEKLLGKMEGQCDAKQFDDAGKTADEIKAVIGS
jgi:hypothetical protein